MLLPLLPEKRGNRGEEGSIFVIITALFAPSYKDSLDRR
jgi:hypothetical protein